MCVYIFFAEVRNRDLDPLYVKLFYCLPAALINESHIFPNCFIVCNCLVSSASTGVLEDIAKGPIIHCCLVLFKAQWLKIIYKTAVCLRIL